MSQNGLHADRLKVESNSSTKLGSASFGPHRDSIGRSADIFIFQAHLVLLFLWSFLEQTSAGAKGSAPTKLSCDFTFKFPFFSGRKWKLTG